MSARVHAKRALLFAAALAAAGALAATALLSGLLAPAPAPPPRAARVAPGETDPAEWGREFPRQHASFAATARPKPSGRSRYKRGLDEDGVTWDRLSQSPALALLLRGSGLGEEWNEPRGHAFAMADLRGVDPSRSVAAGAACLSCKSPHAERIRREAGDGFFRMSLPEAVARIPERHRDLGVSCADCHDARTLRLIAPRRMAGEGFAALGRAALTPREMRTAVCGQCHATFSLLKDAQGRTAGVSFPWEGSAWGGIPVERIIRRLREDPARLEWTQEVTGMRVGMIRHPDFEFYTAGSAHWNAGVACADCHMPPRLDGREKFTDHDVTSPLKNGLRACLPCHGGTAEELSARVIAIQDRCVALGGRAALSAATAAKLFERAREAAREGRTVEAALLSEARDLYLEAFYRVIFLAAENSAGFHNPAEAARIAADAIGFAGRAEGLLRQGLAREGVDVPAAVPLKLSDYVNERGTRAKEGTLHFRPEQEFPDPSGAGIRLFPPAAKGL